MELTGYVLKGASEVPQTVVSFDLDGVIQENPWEKGIGPRIRQHLRRSPLLTGLPAEEADRRATAAIRQAWGRRAAAGEFVACFDWDAVYYEASLDLHLEPPPPVAGMVEEFCAIDGMIRLLPGGRSGPLLLKERGYQVVAITNGYHAYQWPVLRALGIDCLFDAIITPEAAGYAKPDPRLFASVPGLVAHVGDSLLHDILGANLAGLVSVWLHAELPPHFQRAAPLDRACSSGFEAYLEHVMRASPFVPYHPEASAITCLPDAVVVDADEAARVLIERYA